MMLPFFLIPFAMLALVLETAQSQLVIFNSTAAINTNASLSAGCEAALIASISCPPNLFNLAGDGNVIGTDNITVPQLCASSCTNSLSSFHKTVASACSKDPSPWAGVPATWPGDVLWAFANRTCLKNTTTGAYCVDEVLSWWALLDANDTMLVSDVPTNYLCTPCMLNMLAQSQSTSFSNYNANFTSDWLAVQKGKIFL
jgi:hypothetical protein